MTVAIVLTIAAALVLALILGISVSRALQVSTESGLASKIQAVDVVAFRNLVDPAENAYLRRRLPHGEFRRVRRERLRAMAAYVRAAGTNAAVLVRIGQSALSASDPHTVEAARQLVNDALLLRRNTAYAVIKIYAAMAWPDWDWSAAPILHGYEHLNGSAMLLGRLQNPAMPVRISAR